MLQPNVVTKHVLASDLQLTVDKWEAKMPIAYASRSVLPTDKK